MGGVDRDAVVELAITRLGARRSSWNTADLRGQVERIIASLDVIAAPQVRRELAEDLTQRAAGRCLPLLSRDHIDRVPTHVRHLTSPAVLAVEDRANEVLDGARAVEDAARHLCRITVTRPDLTPADVDVVLAHLAAAVASLPPTAAQLGDILGNAKDRYVLSTDSLIPTQDADLLIDTARLHLGRVRESAVTIYRHLGAAQNQAAHVVAEDHAVPDRLRRPATPRSSAAPGTSHRRRPAADEGPRCRAEAPRKGLRPPI